MVVIDVGNSDTVIGFFNKQGELYNNCRIKSLKSENYFFFEYRILGFMEENNIEVGDLREAVISSVVPILTPFFVYFCEKHLKIKPWVVSPSKSRLFKIGIDIPQELGSDLFSNALAASEIYGGNCVVVDFGTALSFTTVSADKEILGVAIFPGIKTAIKSLFSQTSLLPEVKLEKPPTAIGKNTTHAIQSGIYFGYESIVRGIVTKIREEVDGELNVIGTGGLSSTIVELKDIFRAIDMDLTLKGLYIYGTKMVERR